MTVRGRHDGRSGADGLVLAALAGGATAAEAAEAAHVSERTVRRRLADAEFAGRIEDARAEIVDVVLTRISTGALAAADTLLALLAPEEPPSVRLGASRAILDCGMKLRAEQEFSDRLDAIEEHLGVTRRGTP